MRADIVVDLGFGDSGKGITTDYLCSLLPSSSVVVRYNGGQQAGHTVMMGEEKHIFASYGCGSFRKIPTYISEHCTIYPSNIANEHKNFRDKYGWSPELYIHPLAKLTTPYDVAFCRLREKSLKHGSCGIGVGATMKRHLESPYKLFAVDTLNPAVLEQKMLGIRDYYQKLSYEYKLDHSEWKQDEIAHLRILTELHLHDMRDAIKQGLFTIYNYDYILDTDFDRVIFEGAQGIMLDTEHGIFPNVTFSNTTSRNAMAICKELGIRKEDIAIWYVTRCYQTRHGEGWMSSNKPVELGNNREEINIHNEWQGTMRAAEIDYDLLNYAMEVDDAYSYGVRKKNLVVTCIDQRPDFKFEYGKMDCNFDGIYESYSPFSEDFKCIK